MKRLVTVMLVITFLLSLLDSSFVYADTTATPTVGTATATKSGTATGTPATTATGSPAAATPARGAPPSVTEPNATVPAGTRGAPPTIAPTASAAVATASPTAAATGTPVPVLAAASQACTPDQAIAKTPLTTAEGAGTEIVSLRTRTSRSFAPKSPSHKKGAQSSPGTTLIVAPGSLNFQDDKGAWQPIENALVASGGGAKNTANRYTVSLPGDVGGAPVRVALGGASVEMTLVGAKGGGAICGDTETFANALPGVTLAYSAHNDAVKETLTLASATAPHTFVYHLTIGGGLTAKTNGAGIDFVDGKGKVQFAFVPPFMDDKAGAHSAAVSLTLGQDAGGQTVTLAADAKWLSDASRTYPVVIDPTVFFTGSNSVDNLSNNVDCPIAAATPTTNACGGSADAVGWDGTNASRALLQFNLGSVIPQTAQVLYAEVGLHKASQSTSNATTLAVYPLSRSWTNGTTWNSYDGTHAWTTAGGDFSGTALYTNSAGADGSGYWYFPVTTTAQGWVSGATTNNGVIVKEPTENVINVIQFSSSRVADGTVWPYLSVQYHAQLGEQRFYSLLGQGLSDRMNLQVNAVTGNLVIHNHDLHVAGTGLNLDIDRYFNSLTDYADELGYGWQTSQGYDIQLFIGPIDGTIVMLGPTGEYYSFHHNGDGSYTSPPGLDATLVLNGDLTYTLTYHSSNAKLNFDTTGRFLVTSKDKNGNTLTYAYDGNGTLTSITDTQGRSVTYTHDANFFLTKITDSSSRTYQYGYDGNNHLTSYTDPNGKITRYAYTGNVLNQITDPVGNLTKFTYDTVGRVKTVVRVTNNGTGAGATTTFTYNVGNTVVNDPNNHNTTYNYSTQAMVTSVVDVLSHTQAATYNADNNVLTYTDAISPTGNVTTGTYGANNGESLTQVQAPASGTGMTAASGSATFTDTNHPFLPHTATDVQGNVLTYGYNTAGNLTSVTNSLTSNNVASATYNSNGTVATTTDALSHQTTYTYTFATTSPHVLTQVVITPPSPLGAVTAHYDSVGRVSSIVDGKSQTTTYTYNTMNRLTRITFNNDTSCSSRTTCTDYGYDDNGNLTSVIDSTGTTSFTYDKQNHQLTKTLPGAGSASVTYTYDSAGNLLTLADAGGTVTYHYNAANLLDSLAEPGGSCSGTISLCTTFTYDNNNRRLTTIYPNGVVLTQAYDNSGNLTSIVGTKSGSTLTSYTYTYQQGTNDRALRQRMTTGGTTTYYCYDVLNRLTGATTSSPCTSGGYQYTYDGAGNRLTATVGGTSVYATPTFNNDNELTALGTVTFGYDGNGNETGRSAGITALAYNAKNQTTSMTAGGSALAMTYTGDSQVERLTAGSDSFGYGVLGLGGKTTGGSTTYYTRTNGGRLISERIGGSSYYYLFDGLGSMVALTDSAGVVKDTYTYDPYGQVTPGGSNSVANPWQYTAGYYDSQTGLVKLGQRFYDPSLGRFTQLDPLGGGYEYTADNPVSFIDPTGLFTFGLTVGASISLGPIQIQGQLGVQVSASTQFGVQGGVTATGGLAAETLNVGANGPTVGVQVSDAQQVSDLGGPFYQVGVSGGELGRGSGDYFTGSSPDGPVHGVDIGVGFGADVVPVSGYSGVTGTGGWSTGGGVFSPK